MASTARSSCPTCGRPAGELGENKTFPFCSERCRTIDLGRWLDERYRIPTREAPPDGNGQDDDSSG
jgi:endogenous inhibitor of DNA gyrase (YacG/DUF329 family)